MKIPCKIRYIDTFLLHSFKTMKYPSAGWLCIQPTCLFAGNGNVIVMVLFQSQSRCIGIVGFLLLFESNYTITMQLL